MEGNTDTETQQKRTRTNPTRKWTVAREKALIEYMLEHTEIEKPTIQAYYRRFSEEKNVPVEWKLARAKVRNMRVSYNKAKDWKGSTGAGSMDGETVKSTLLKMCSYYLEFDNIFGHKVVDTSFIQESLDFCNSAELDFGESTQENSSIEIEVVRSTSRTAVSDIMQFQVEMVQLKRQRMDQDLDIKERELNLKERELMNREKEIAIKEKEIEFKEKEMYSQEKIKILKLEMKERLAVEELKYK